MTAITIKPRQKRLDKCVLARSKWTQIHDKPRQHVRRALKIDDLLTDTAVRVETVQEKGQNQRNTELLGKYQFR